MTPANVIHGGMLRKGFPAIVLSWQDAQTKSFNNLGVATAFILNSRTYNMFLPVPLKRFFPLGRQPFLPFLGMFLQPCVSTCAISRVSSHCTSFSPCGSAEREIGGRITCVNPMALMSLIFRSITCRSKDGSIKAEP